MQPQSRLNEKILDRIPSDKNLLTSPATNRSLRVFVLSNVRLCREGLALLLAQRRSIEIVGSASAPKAIGEIIELQADIVLLDASAIDVRTLASGICDAVPNSKVVAEL